MSDKFAKLFEVGEQQVLITREFSNEEGNDEFGVNITTEIGGIRASVKLGFKTEELCDEAFNSFDEAKSTEVFNNLKNALE